MKERIQSPAPDQNKLKQMMEQQAQQPKPKKDSVSKTSSENGGLQEMANKAAENLSQGIFKFLPFLVTIAKGFVNSIGRNIFATGDDLFDGAYKFTQKLKR
jgi:hypothetical protein